jgi:alkylhydroperoxidase family enzyme
LDEGLVRSITLDYENALLTPADRAMLDYVGKLTRDATTIGPADHEGLRAHGFDDRGILQVTLIASWFNYIKRVADALGVGRETPAAESGEGAQTATADTTRVTDPR